MEEGETPQRKVRYQNTFRQFPEIPFDVTKVKTHLINVLELNLKEVEYSDQTVKDLCLSVSDEIRTAIKGENFDRYRIIVTVTMGEKKMQGVQVSHSFLWDENRDRFAEHVYETNGFYAQAVVYGVYRD